MNAKQFHALCTPAQVYFVLCVLSILAILMQKYQDFTTDTVERSHTKVPHHNMLYFVFKILYVIVWTFLLQLLCKHGYNNVSWFLVLLPFMVMIGLVLLSHIV
jgi:hypothetical protein